VRYEILGPLRVVDRQGSSWVSASKVESLLAVLLIRCDQVVRLDQLINEIWGCGAPRRATAGLHVYISQLRKFLSRPDRPDSPIVTQPPGYLLRLGTDELDLLIFQQRVAAGRAYSLGGSHAAAADMLESALGLWRGPVLGDLHNGPIAEGFTTWLLEERLECVETLMEAYLTLGRHRSLIGRLYALTAEHPLRETFYLQLMLALYRSDRRADALKVYQDAHRTLAEELGLQPCRALQDMQRAILRADHTLDLCAAA
jgi:DNA-binding SARP family transcriptional activator